MLASDYLQERERDEYFVLMQMSQKQVLRISGGQKQYRTVGFGTDCFERTTSVTRVSVGTRHHTLSESHYGSQSQNMAGKYTDTEGGCFVQVSWLQPQSARHVRALLAAGLTQPEMLLYLARKAESLTFRSVTDASSGSFLDLQER